MIPIQHSIVIQRPRKVVFNFVTNTENDSHWWKPVIRTEKLIPGEMRVGSEFRQVTKVLGVLTVYNHLKVTEYAPFDYVRYHAESAQLPFDLLYRFTPTGDATTFTLEAELSPKGILRVVLPILMWSLNRELKTYFGLLKSYLEGLPHDASISPTA